MAAEGNAAADTAEGVGLGGKGPVTGYREGASKPEKETPARRGVRGTQEAALLREALSQKKEEATRGAEAKEETSQAFPAVRFRLAVWFRQRGALAGSHVAFGNTGTGTSGKFPAPVINR